MIEILFWVAGGAVGGGLVTYAVMTMPPEDPRDDTWSRERHPSGWDQ
jgi:hypothetical protein